MFFEPPLPPRIEFLFHDLFSFNPIDKYLGGGGQVPDAERVEVKVVRGGGGGTPSSPAPLVQTSFVTSLPPSFVL